MQFAGMQHEPRCMRAARPRQTAVEIAAEYGMTQQLAVDAQLMGAACLRHQADPGQWQGLAPRALAELATLGLAAEMHDVALDGCPTIDTLVADGVLSTETPRTDPWRRPYEIICDTSGPRARSAGPDAAFGTSDDL